MTKPEVLEGEIISGSAPNLHKKSTSESNLALPNINKAAIWLLLIACIPVIGFLVAIGSYIVARLRKKSIILPIVCIVISMFITGTFLVLRFIIKAIF